MYSALNENIQKLRTSMGLNQVELAKVMNVSKQCVSNWENDNVQPSIEMLMKLSDFFKVSTDYLLGRTGTDIVDLTGLTTAQAAHFRLLLSDFLKANKKA
ncbi:MAG: helix-turn-helix domain-containing protein [Clostridia bacterium]|nr:helix-turn-helix domain-containing protein [Clostridia bacterium]